MRWLPGILLLLAACTWNNGQRTSSLQVSLATVFPGAGGEITTDDGYVVTVDSAVLHTTGAALKTPATTSTTSTTTFDPSTPPPGCTLCHEGHCHCGDRLLSYEELAGGGGVSGEGPSVAYPGEVQLDVRGGGPVMLPEHVVPDGAYARLVMDPARLVVIGRVRGGALAGEEHFRMELPDLISSGFGAAGDLEVSPEREPRVRATLTVTLPAALLDGIQFSNLESRNGARMIDAAFAPTDVARMRLAIADTTTATLAVARDDDTRYFPPPDPALPKRDEFDF